MEHRRFKRLTCAAQAELQHQGMTYRTRLENISPAGALLSSHDCILVPSGDTCTLAILIKAEDPPLVLSVVIRHSFFSMVGVEFVAFEGDAEARLSELLRSLSGPPQTPRRTGKKAPEMTLAKPRVPAQPEDKEATQAAGSGPF